MNKLSHALMSILFTPVNKNKDVLVCFASQTGTAENLANQTGEVIQQSGRAVQVESLSSITPSDLMEYQQVLMIVSTCGEGEMPDEGKLFYDQLAISAPFSVPTYVLALGDKSYTYFCSAGIKMHETLLFVGAAAEPQATLVSGNPFSAWQNWLANSVKIDVNECDAKPLNHSVELVLKARRPLHQKREEQGSNQAYHLDFELIGVDSYQANELVGITPPMSSRERLYSIASSSHVRPNHLSLTIAKHQFMLNGELKNGACSHFLIEELSVGDAISAEIKLGAGMPVPESAVPTILVATGAGIAPMMSLLNEREKLSHNGENWLTFGNRYSDGDFYYREELQAYQDSGVINQLDIAFSRDDEQKVYVQDKLKQNQAQLAEWLLDKGAQLYVCGRPELKVEILQVIEEAILKVVKDKNIAKEKLCQLRHDGKIYFELF